MQMSEKCQNVWDERRQGDMNCLGITAEIITRIPSHALSAHLPIRSEYDLKLYIVSMVILSFLGRIMLGIRLDLKTHIIAKQRTEVKFT